MGGVLRFREVLVEVVDPGVGAVVDVLVEGLVGGRPAAAAAVHLVRSAPGQAALK